MKFEQQEINILHSDSGPYGIAISHEGMVWFTQHKANKISCIDKKGQVQEYTVPTPDAGVMCLTASSKGDIWFTENRANKIGN